MNKTLTNEEHIGNDLRGGVEVDAMSKITLGAGDRFFAQIHQRNHALNPVGT